MKETIYAFTIVALLVVLQITPLSSYGEKNSFQEINETISFPFIKLKQEQSYLEITVEGYEEINYMSREGEPMLPVFTKTYSFPLGTKILEVNCEPRSIDKFEMEGKIKPAPKVMPKVSINEEKSSYESLYSNSESYPNYWYDYSIKCGIINDERSIFLIINLYPIRYLHSTNTIYQARDFDIVIRYKESNEIRKYENEYDMVIVAPRVFSRILKPLIDHKNSLGVRTFLKTTESICKGDYEGRDSAEKLKYFIKDAIETYNVKYVLLFGGRVGELYRWYVPVRYSSLDEGSFWEREFISDLYFADIYKYNESSATYEFDNWDSNGNSKFGEWYWNKFEPDDKVDLVPDVYIGRLPCRNIRETRIVVDKILYYERNTYGKDWFKKIIVVGGDTVPSTDSSDPEYSYYEGEIETSLGASYILPLGFNVTELFTSKGTYAKAYDLVKEFDKGAGFILLSGHGSPVTFSTHLPNSENWIDFTNFHITFLRNKDRLPICVVGGCHNNQFDVTNLNLIKGLIKERLRYFKEPGYNYDEGGFWKAEWASRCWGEKLVFQKNGGTIATIGNTALGYGVSGNDCVNYNDGWIISHFFQVYYNLTQHSNDTLGKVHSTTIREYISNFTNSWDIVDSKTVQEWALIGDPSLKIGGYPFV